MDKKGTKICANCEKSINLKKDNFVLVGTYNRPVSKDDEQYFHFQCWVDYFNSRVSNRMKANVDYMRNKVMEIISKPEIKNQLKEIEGTGVLMNMLNTPLNQKPEKVDITEDKKGENGRGNKKKKSI